MSIRWRCRTSARCSTLYDPATVKVLHAASQDLEIFITCAARCRSRCSTHQIAASLLGHGEQAGYGTLVESLLSITLDKSQSRTDWAQRPLDATQLAYAADDVRHPRSVYGLLLDELARLGRRDWLGRISSISAAAIATRPIRPKPGAGSKARACCAAQLAVLARLAEWREQQGDGERPATQMDRRRRPAARSGPHAAARDEAQLGKLRTLEAATARRHGATLLALVAEARAQPKESWPQLPQRRQLAAEQEALVDAMMADREGCAACRKASAPAQLRARANSNNWSKASATCRCIGWRAGVAGRKRWMFEGRLALAVRGRPVAHLRSLMAKSSDRPQRSYWKVERPIAIRSASRSPLSAWPAPARPPWFRQSIS